MAITRAEVVDYLSGLTILDMAELVKELESKWGVSAAAATVAVASTETAAKVEEKTEFDVVLKEAGKDKIKVIKVVKDATNLGLKEAKELVDGAPKTIKEALPKDQADALKAQLEAVGAVVEIE